MMILVVHDREEVAQEIRGVVEALGVAAANVDVAEDGITARKALQECLYDLAIVDLTIPHIKNKTPTTYSTAEELLIELFSADTMNPPGDVIGLTRDAKALDAIAGEIGPHLMVIIQEDSNGAWKKSLSDRIKYVTKAATARQRSLNRHFEYDVAIITALDKEFAPYNEIFDLTEVKHFPGTKTFLFEDKNGDVRRGVTTSIGRAGQPSAASVTQSVLSLFRPRLCLMTGFCGGFEEKVREGDIIFAQSVFDWDSGKWKGVGDQALFVPRPDPISITDLSINSVVRDLVQSKPREHDSIVGHASKLSNGGIVELRMKMGPVASGSAVVADPLLIPRIQNLNEGILGVDMEAYGFYYAARHTRVVRPNFLMIKTVADYCDREKHDRYHAAANFLSAKMAEEIICQRYDFQQV